MSELQVQHIALTNIIWGENDRKHFGKQELEELAATIRAHGVLEPIGVTPVEDRFKGLWGQRRCAAAKMAGLNVIPAVICAKGLTEADAHELQLIENCARASLRPLEQAIGLARYMKTSGLAASDVAKRVGLNPAVVSKSLALLSLPDPLREQINAGAISAAAGYELSRIDDPQLQSELASEVAAGRLSRDGVVGKVRAARRDPLDASKTRSRVTAKLRGGRLVTLCGSNLNVDSVIAALEELLSRCRSAKNKGLTISTMIKVMADEARQNP